MGGMVAPQGVRRHGRCPRRHGSCEDRSMRVVRFELAMFGRVGCATVVAMSVPAIAEARTPLPTIEVVQPKRPVRLLDLRWNLQVGGAMVLGDRVPLLA